MPEAKCQYANVQSFLAVPITNGVCRKSLPNPCPPLVGANNDYRIPIVTELKK
jgi:hypothetical protein